MKTRLFFASDIHGSDRCWKKLLKVPERYRVDVVVVGGDLTGKMIVPIIKVGEEEYRYELYGRRHELKGERELEEAKRKIGEHGYYPYVCTQDEFQGLSSDEAKVKELFERLMVQRILDWVDEAEAKLKRLGVKFFMSPGNDDTFAIDEAIKKSKFIAYCEGMVVDVDDHHEMISLAWVNDTPWNTPRETGEEELEKMLESLISKVRNVDSLICNVHAPPFGSGLDMAPRLGKDLSIKIRMGGAGVEMIPVGSKAVRKVIEKYQPLLGLHGHIHESSGHRRIGRTLCVNPGSEYVEGILRGYVVDIEPDRVREFWRVSL